jgi:hypothetical protein
MPLGFLRRMVRLPSLLVHRAQLSRRARRGDRPAGCHRCVRARGRDWTARAAPANEEDAVSELDRLEAAISECREIELRVTAVTKLQP